MRINFRKVSAIASSILMLGMTAGIAAAANFPSPFVVNGSPNVAIVYGSGAAFSDSTAASDIATSLNGFVSGGSASVSGESASLGTGSDKLWLNTSLNSVKSTLTKSDLPTVLQDYTFSGNVDSKMTSTINIPAGNTATATTDANTGTVIFAKQPKTSNDPVVGISLGTGNPSSHPLYNASVTMSAINFTSADSEGQEIVLFGQKFTVSADSDTNSIVLLKQAQKVSLSSDSATTTVTVDGKTYTVTLVSASDTSATIQVTDSAGASDSREVTEATSKKIQGLEVGVINADENNLKYSASVIVGAQKLTFTNAQPVTTGDSGDQIDGTYAYITGGTGATTALTVAVNAPDSSTDALLPGQTFVDPVFGSFKVVFGGLSSPLGDSTRETMSVQPAGDDTMSLTMTDSNGNSGTFDFAHNATSGAGLNYQPANWRLADDNNNSIYPYEMANLTEDDFVVLGNENYGHLLQVQQLSNSSSDYTNDKVKLVDVLSGDTYDTVFTSVCLPAVTCGTISIGGKQYGVVFNGQSGDGGWVQFKYPTSDSTATQYVLYPTIQTQNGGNLALYEPLKNVALANFNKSGTAGTSVTFNLPDGDGYTAVTATYVGISAGGGNWTIGGKSTDLNATANGNSTLVTVGQLVYNFTASGTANQTNIYLTSPEDSVTNIAAPAVVLFEGRDDKSTYNAVVIPMETMLEAGSAGSSTNGVGVSDILYSSPYYHSADLQMPSNTDMSEQVDWWGTLGTTDASDSDQKIATLSYPESQVFANVYFAAEGATVSGTGALGNVLVTDSQVGTVNSKNLIVVGGSCINSAAASLVGGAYCGSAWTTATGAGSGQFLIKGYASSGLTSEMALLVAGYEAADTTNAATYLRTQTVDTGKTYLGTSSTTATLQTTSA